MPSISLRTFGDSGRRGRYLTAEAQGRRYDLARKRRDDAAKAPTAALFSVDEHHTLSNRISAHHKAGDTYAMTTWSILGRTLRSRSFGMVALVPSVEGAALLGDMLRRPDVNGYCIGLQRLDEIAGRPTPVVRSIEMAVADLIATIANLEAVKGEGAPRAAAAATLLRTAGINRALARIYVTPEAAPGLADALHAVGAGRLLVSKIDSIAGRTGYRPAA